MIWLILTAYLFVGYICYIQLGKNKWLKYEKDNDVLVTLFIMFLLFWPPVLFGYLYFRNK